MKPSKKIRKINWEIHKQLEGDQTNNISWNKLIAYANELLSKEMDKHES